MSYITFNGKSSKDFHLRLENDLEFSSPERDVSFEKVAGVDGEIAVGDGSLKNTQISYPFYVEVPVGKSIEGVASDISNWLKSDSLWHDLYFDGDSKYIYRGIFVDEYNVQRIISSFGKCVLPFRVKPYKFLKTGLTEQTLGTTITNPEARNARPKMIIKGAGIIQLKIGSETFSAKAVDGGLIVDTLYDTVTDLTGKRTQWEKVTTYPLPVIKPGKQTITKSDTITEVKIIPRWEAIIG